MGTHCPKTNLKMQSKIPFMVLVGLFGIALCLADYIECDKGVCAHHKVYHPPEPRLEENIVRSLDKAIQSVNEISARFSNAAGNRQDLLGPILPVSVSLITTHEFTNTKNAKYRINLKCYENFHTTMISN